MRRMTGQRLAALVCGAFVFTLVLELLARVDDRISFGAPLLSNPSLLDLQVWDATGIRGRPKARFQHWRMNGLGVQGVETSFAKSAGTLRVVVLGASESFGPYESPGMSYPAQLERLLRARLSQPVEVLNAALPGMSLPRVVEYCRHRLAQLQTDFIVYYPSPVSYLADEPPSRAAAAPEPTGFALRSPAKLAHGINRALPEAVRTWRLESGQRRALARLRRERPAAWLFRDVPQERLALFERDLEALATCVASQDTRFVLATHAHRFGPQRSRADALHLLAWQVFYPRAEANVLLGMEDAANAVITRVAAKSRVTLADVASAVPRDARYFQDFVHFTDAGSTRVAAVFENAISHAARR